MDKYIYISIPKTGTNSVHEILGNTDYNHITANMIKKKIGDKKYDSKISFCFIRNPIDLVKSWYYYHKYNPRVPLKEGKKYYPETIEEWILKKKCKTHWEEKEHKKNNPNWNLVNPLYIKNWICDENGEIIVKELYKFEEIEEVIKKKFKVKIGKKNESNKDNYELSEQIKESLKEMFKEDIVFYENLPKRYLF